MKIFAILLIGFTMLSCEREPLGNDSGSSVSATEIQLAQNRSLSKLNPYTVKAGQRIHHIETQEVISSQAPVKQLSKEWVTEVLEVENSESARYLTTSKQVTDKLYDKDFIYEFKNVYSLPQIETLSLLDQFNNNRYSMKSMLQNLSEQDQVEATEIQGVAYQNLSESRVSLVPPELVKDAKGCKSLQNCRIEADQIKYDIVFLLSDGTRRTHNIEWLISDQVPFFAAILKQCASTIVPLENLRVLVKQCNEVVDFDEE